MSTTKDIVPYLKNRTKPILKQLKLMNETLIREAFESVDFSVFQSTIERQIQTADKKFTICFYGSFSGGKSTIINGLLGLKGEQRLSSDHYKPDTAKSIRLCKRISKDQAEAKILYKNGAVEETTWKEAKNLTSQVYLSKNNKAEASAKEIIEIEYRIEGNQILELCDIVDLPGTGTAFGNAHNKIANERIKESELIFWVIPTVRPEPDGNELRNLQTMQDVKANIVPLINVWQDLEEEREGMVEVKELEPLVIRTYGRYFSNQPTVLKYYARECDKAQQRGEEPADYMGYQVFKDFIFKGLIGDQQGSRMKTVRRIAGAITGETNKLQQWIDQRGEELNQQLSGLGLEDESARLLREECEQIEFDLEDRIQYKANIAADEMVNIFIDQATFFLEKKMSGFNLNKIRRKRKKKELQAKMEEEFKTQYLMLDKPNGPINSIAKKYLNEATRDIKFLWHRFVQMPQVNNDKTGISSDQAENFVATMFDNIGFNSMNKGVDFVFHTAILAGLMAVPGAQIFLAVGILGYLGKEIFGKDAEEHRLRTTQDAHLNILQHKPSLANKLVEEAVALHKKTEKAFFDNWNREASEREQKRIDIQAAKNKTTEVLKQLQKLSSELNDWANTNEG